MLFSETTGKKFVKLCSYTKMFLRVEIWQLTSKLWTLKRFSIQLLRVLLEKSVWIKEEDKKRKPDPDDSNPQWFWSLFQLQFCCYAKQLIKHFCEQHTRLHPRYSVSPNFVKDAAENDMSVRFEEKIHQNFTSSKTEKFPDFCETFIEVEK